MDAITISQYKGNRRCEAIFDLGDTKLLLHSRCYGTTILEKSR